MDFIKSELIKASFQKNVNKKKKKKKCSDIKLSKGQRQSNGAKGTGLQET